MTAWLLISWFFTGAIALPAFPAVLMAVSIIDDWRGLPAAIRFASHLIVAAVFAVVAFPALPWFVLLILVIGIVWMTNLYNFMDGSDGLAGGMSVFGFGSYGVVAAFMGGNEIAALSFSLAAAAAAFLWFNFHPAKIFMGDAGSIPLGFLAAALGLIGWQKSLWPLWYPLLVFSPFIVDASVTLMRRFLRGEKIWQAHREHYYQRLVRMGFGHRKTALLEYAVMFACALSGVFFLKSGFAVQTIFLSVWVAVYIVLAILIDQRWLRKSNNEA